MRRTLLAFAVGLALTPAAPATASHPCLDVHPVTCWATSLCLKHLCP